MKINGQQIEAEVSPDVTLLDFLREQAHLAGTKKGCDHGQCGAYTVLANGKRINSCLTLAIMKDGVEITTIEGLANGARRAGLRRRTMPRHSAAGLGEAGTDKKLEVKFADHWQWDMVMHLMQCEFTFLDADTKEIQATAHYRNSLFHKFPSRTGVVKKIFAQLDKQGAFSKN